MARSNYQRLLIMTGILLWAVCLSVGNDEGCNEFVCGSVVSKCLLTQSCQCKLNDCFCCKDCLNCLGDLYTECCGCLDMCPTNNNNANLSALMLRSEIGDIEGGGVPELFETLTAEDDEEQWTTMRFPMRVRKGGDAIERMAAAQKSMVVNCTVIYLNACIRSTKCQKHCESMGATAYRWFHDGCCECVGAHCLNYGINESRCSACPEEELPEKPESKRHDDMADELERELNFGNEEGLEDDETWDYGEDENFYN